MQQWSYPLMHTSFQHLLDYLEESLNPEQVAKISLHLARCPECQRTLFLACQFLTNTRGSKQQRAATKVMSRPFEYTVAIGITTSPPSPTGERLAVG
jgi:hypothetical protein